MKIQSASKVSGTYPRSPVQCWLKISQALQMRNIERGLGAHAKRYDFQKCLKLCDFVPSVLTGIVFFTVQLYANVLGFQRTERKSDENCVTFFPIFF